jgi:hypothetical protein
MNSLNVFIHFLEEMVSKMYQSIYWTNTIFKLKTILIKCKYILEKSSFSLLNGIFNDVIMTCDQTNVLHCHN